METIVIDKILYDAFSYCIRIDKDKKLDRDVMEQKIKLYQKGEKQPLIDFIEYLKRKSLNEICLILPLNYEIGKQ